MENILEKVDIGLPIILNYFIGNNDQIDANNKAVEDCQNYLRTNKIECCDCNNRANNFMWLWDKTIIWCCNDCFDAIWFDQYQNIAQAGKTKILE